MNGSFLRSLYAVALTLVLPVMAAAQGGGAGTTGTIAGRVTDSSDSIADLRFWMAEIKSGFSGP